MSVEYWLRIRHFAFSLFAVYKRNEFVKTAIKLSQRSRFFELIIFRPNCRRPSRGGSNPRTLRDESNDVNERIYACSNAASWIFLKTGRVRVVFRKIRTRGTRIYFTTEGHITSVPRQQSARYKWCATFRGRDRLVRRCPTDISLPANGTRYTVMLYTVRLSRRVNRSSGPVHDTIRARVLRSFPRCCRFLKTGPATRR